MAGISTSFKLVVFGLLLLAISAFIPAKSSIIREVIDEEVVKAPGGETWNIELVDIIMKPKARVNQPILRCVGLDESCGPLYPCCGSMTCVFDWQQTRFRCVGTKIETQVGKGY